ncbi:MAG: preprotein translocase subunit SecG [Clostridia bacterium]|nr:preprotein translocase subunit SecG [Clostridia bacterium]
MDILENVLYIVYAVICVVIIILTLIQRSEDGGASGAIMGSSSANFYEKNKGRTKEGKLKRATITLGVVFVILTVVLTILSLGK